MKRAALFILALTGSATAAPPPIPTPIPTPPPIPTPTPTPPPTPTPTPIPTDDLASNLLDAFTGWPLLYYGGAVAATGAMAFSGADHSIRLAFQRDLHAPAWADASYVAGYAVPALTAPVIYLVGVVGDDRGVAGAGAAAVQALVVTLATTGLLKVAVGRVYPLNGGDPNAPDRLDHPEYARTFRPFQAWNAAWPSGHTSSTISIAAALTAYAPDAWWIPALGYPLALAIGLGMVDRDSHWASDVVGGALMGHAIGWTIGRNFRERMRGARARDAGKNALNRVQIVPLGTGGAALVGEW